MKNVRINKKMKKTRKRAGQSQLSHRNLERLPMVSLSSKDMLTEKKDFRAYLKNKLMSKN